MSKKTAFHAIVASAVLAASYAYARRASLSGDGIYDRRSNSGK